MAKRFTDSEKWKKPFIRSLKAPYKLLWFYIWDECDHAGLWQVDFQVAQVKIGEKLKISDAIKAFEDKIVPVQNGEIWFIPSFIDEQYVELSETNRAHSKVILMLKRFNLIDENLKIKGLISPLQGAKEEEQEEDKEQEKDKGGTGGKLKPHPFAESQYFDKVKFESAFANSGYENYNLIFYYESVKNWSAQSPKNNKTDWVATARNFMLRDFKDGHPVLKNSINGQPRPNSKQSGLTNLKQSIADDLERLTRDDSAQRA